MDVREAKELYQRYKNGLCSPQECRIVEAVKSELESGEDLVNEELYALQEEIQLQRLLDAAGNPVTPVRSISIFRRRIWWAAAASVMIIGASVLFFTTQRNTTLLESPKEVSVSDLDPGSNRAILTLAGGEKIDLSNAENGSIAQQAGATVTKSAAGVVNYSANAKGSESPVINKISTPRGGTYIVTLPDGTKAWLNAASSITFPTSFGPSAVRSVSITGECYFEVVHNPRQPFIVESENQRIEVLGTHFNVKTYADEPDVTTTLIEGKVKVSSGKENAVLSPGNRTVNRKGKISVEAANTEAAIGWKDGNSKFVGADMSTILRDISRWYDIDIIYDGDPPAGRFTFRVSRKWKLSFFQELLKENNINSKIVKSGARTSLIVSKLTE